MKTSVALGLAGLLLAACPPVLSGEACQTDCNCPTGQSCQAGADGGTCETGQNLCGQDAGGTSPDAGTQGIFGTVTLNNGAAKPSGNAAWVFAFEGAIPDAGTSAALFIATTDSTGKYSIPSAVAGTSYYLLAEYDITNDGDDSDPGHVAKYASVGPVQVSQAAVDIDVVTYECAIFGFSTSPSSAAQLFEAFADVPDVQTGKELQSGVTVTVASSGLSPQTLQYQGPTNDPLSSDLWAYAPAGTRPLADPTYNFTVTGNFYNDTPCVVRRVAPNTFPSDLKLGSGTVALTASSWSTAALRDTTEWTPAVGRSFDLVTLSEPDGTAIDKVQMTDGGTSLTFASGVVPITDCPVSGSTFCDFNLASVFETATGISLSIESTSADLPFQTD